MNLSSSSTSKPPTRGPSINIVAHKLPHKERMGQGQQREAFCLQQEKEEEVVEGTTKTLPKITPSNTIY